MCGMWLQWNDEIVANCCKRDVKVGRGWWVGKVGIAPAWMSLRWQTDWLRRNRAQVDGQPVALRAQELLKEIFCMRHTLLQRLDSMGGWRRSNLLDRNRIPVAWIESCFRSSTRNARAVFAVRIVSSLAAFLFQCGILRTSCHHHCHTFYSHHSQHLPFTIYHLFISHSAKIWFPSSCRCLCV